MKQRSCQTNNKGGEVMPNLEVHLICDSDTAVQYILDKVLEVTRNEKQVTVTIVKVMR